MKKLMLTAFISLILTASVYAMDEYPGTEEAKLDYCESVHYEDDKYCTHEDYCKEIYWEDEENCKYVEVPALEKSKKL